MILLVRQHNKTNQIKKLTKNKETYIIENMIVSSYLWWNNKIL